MIETTSLCPVCFGTIPARITINDHVWMNKQCPDHGEFTAMVEKDPLWFMFCRQHGSTNIYNGYMIDITDRCNITCKYCYHKNGSSDRTIADILQEAEVHKELAPFFLSGGEPTLHPDLPEIIKKMSGIGGTILLTNGIRVCDEPYFDSLIDAGLLEESCGILRVGLSLHKESQGKDLEFLAFCKKRGYRIATVLCVIDDVHQIDECLSVYREYRDVIINMRIKGASRAWNEKKPENKIFVSDMILYLESIGRTDVMIEDHNNKTSFGCVCHDGMSLILVSWYDVYNIDLEDINCPPYYRANDGNIYNMLTAFVVNEGMMK